MTRHAGHTQMKMSQGTCIHTGRSNRRQQPVYKQQAAPQPWPPPARSGSRPPFAIRLVLCVVSSLEQAQLSGGVQLVVASVAGRRRPWGGLLAATRMASRRAPGLRRKMRSCCTTSRRTAMAAGGPYRGWLVHARMNSLLVHHIDRRLPCIINQMI